MYSPLRQDVLVIQGLALGLLAALAATRLLQGFMFGISTLDPLTYVTAALLTAVAAAACAGPAWRAAHLDPLVALRRE
jgi:putative ABC transport system permease protein